jgi:hypothetical protein
MLGARGAKHEVGRSKVKVQSSEGLKQVTPSVPDGHRGAGV